VEHYRRMLEQMEEANASLKVALMNHELEL
jgi:hypothetical protein